MKNIRIVSECNEQTFILKGEFECREDCINCILRFNCLTNDNIYNNKSYLNISVIDNYINEIPYKITWYDDEYKITEIDGKRFVTLHHNFGE